MCVSPGTHVNARECTARRTFVCQCVCIWVCLGRVRLKAVRVPPFSTIHLPLCVWMTPFFVSKPLACVCVRVCVCLLCVFSGGSAPSVYLCLVGYRWLVCVYPRVHLCPSATGNRHRHDCTYLRVHIPGDIPTLCPIRPSPPPPNPRLPPPSTRCPPSPPPSAPAPFLA